MEKNNQESGGEFAAGFGLGAVAGVGFAHFLQSNEGKQLRDKFSSEFSAIKQALFEEGLIPHDNMTALEIFTHMATHIATLVDDAPQDSDTKSAEKKARIAQPAVLAKQTKKAQKKFKGV